ncbi:MAG TPA: aspartate racemase, partial [Lachnospiraceae bacterium]|nr:aspartate racemase [Lachnospiraceae bacterium]
MDKKILGVIGGLGPMATAYFLRLVTDMTDAETDQEHIETIIISRPATP